MWPYLLGVYQLASSAEERSAQDGQVQLRYKQLVSEWQSAELVAKKREDQTSTPAAGTKPSCSEAYDQATKMAFYRKDSSLSNEVFLSVDAPGGGLGGGEVMCRPETVVEETSCAASPTSELADGGAENTRLSDSLQTGMFLTSCIASR